MLLEAGAFLLKSRDEVFAWLGRRAPTAHKEHALSQGQTLAEDCPWPMREERQGKESSLFKEKFKLWDQGGTLAVKAQGNIKPKWNMPQPAKKPAADPGDLSLAKYSEADLRAWIKDGALPKE